MNTKLCASAFIIVVVGLSGPAAGQAQEGVVEWTTFSVPQFGTRVDYPATIFSISEGKSENGIGERFRTSDGRALLSIYSTANDAGETPATYLKRNLRRPRSALQLERVAPSFFAISEETEDTIFYSRCNFSNNRRIHCLDLVYPYPEKRTWEPIVTRLSTSLRPLRSAGIAPGHAPEGEGTVGWKTFSVPQFGTRVDYPASIFSVPEGKPENGIGERFRTSDGRASFSVYSTVNDAGETPVTYLKNNLRRPRSSLQYERITPFFFAISEETKDTIFYSRCNFSINRRIHCLDLMYPYREKRAWDPIVTRISRSLRPLHR